MGNEDDGEKAEHLKITLSHSNNALQHSLNILCLYYSQREAYLVLHN
jgi:hypothetical protein